MRKHYLIKLNRFVCCLVILSLFLQFLPAREPAQAAEKTIFQRAGEWLTKLVTKVALPDISLTEQGQFKVGPWPLLKAEDLGDLACLEWEMDTTKNPPVLIKCKKPVNPFSQFSLGIKSQIALVEPVIISGCGEMTDEIWSEAIDAVTIGITPGSISEKFSNDFITKKITGCTAVPCLESEEICRDDKSYKDYANEFNRGGCYEWYMDNKKKSVINRDNETWGGYWEYHLGEILGTFENIKKAYAFYKLDDSNAGAVAILEGALKNLAGQASFSDAYNETNPKYKDLRAYAIPNIKGDGFCFDFSGDNMCPGGVNNLTPDGAMQKRHEYFIKVMTATIPSLIGLKSLDNMKFKWFGDDTAGTNSARVKIKNALAILDAGKAKDLAIFGLTLEQIRTISAKASELKEKAKASPECINPVKGELTIPKPYMPEICQLSIPLPGDNKCEGYGEKCESKILAKNKACVYLNRLQNSASEEVYSAFKIFNATDPFTDCLFVKNCRTNCSLRMGEITFTVSLLDIAALIVPGGFLTVVQKILNIAKIINEAFKIYTAIKDTFKSGVKFLSDLFNVMGNLSTMYASFTNLGLNWSDMLIYGVGSVASQYAGGKLTAIGVSEGGNIGWLKQKGGNVLSAGDGLLGGVAGVTVLNIDQVGKATNAMQDMLGNFAQNNLKFVAAKTAAIKANEKLKKNVDDIRQKFKSEPEFSFFFETEGGDKPNANKKKLNSILDDVSLAFESLSAFLGQITTATNLKDGRPVKDLEPGGKIDEWASIEKKAENKFFCTPNLNEALELPLGSIVSGKQDSYICYLKDRVRPILGLSQIAGNDWLTNFKNITIGADQMASSLKHLDSDYIKQQIVGCKDLVCFQDGQCSENSRPSDCSSLAGKQDSNLLCYGRNNKGCDLNIREDSGSWWRVYWQDLARILGTTANVVAENKVLSAINEKDRTDGERTRLAHLDDLLWDLYGKNDFIQGLGSLRDEPLNKFKYQNILDYTQQAKMKNGKLKNMKEQDSYIHLYMPYVFPPLIALSEIGRLIDTHDWLTSRDTINAQIKIFQSDLGRRYSLLSSKLYDLLEIKNKLRASVDSNLTVANLSNNKGSIYWNDVYWYQPHLTYQASFSDQDVYPVDKMAKLNYEGDAAYEDWDSKIAVIENTLTEEKIYAVKEAMRLKVSPQSPIVVYKIAKVNDELKKIDGIAVKDIGNNASWDEIANKIIDAIIYGTPKVAGADCSKTACPFINNSQLVRNCAVSKVLEDDCKDGIYQVKIFPNKKDYRNYNSCCIDETRGATGGNQCCGVDPYTSQKMSCQAGYDFYKNGDFYKQCEDCKKNNCGISCESCPKDDGLSLCGNGKVEGTEECDDGNSSNLDACVILNAVSASQRDATKQADEKCRNVVDYWPCYNSEYDALFPMFYGGYAGVESICKKATCGDGYVWNNAGGAEQCDDGNTRNGDGCSSVCKNEAGITKYTCAMECPTPSTCFTQCKEVTSGFTRGMFLDKQACLASGCGGVPSVSCGNGKIDSGEQCDGANLDGQTCETQGFTGGTLSCKAGCTSFNTSKCSSNVNKWWVCANFETECKSTTVPSPYNYNNDTCDGKCGGQPPIQKYGCSPSTLKCEPNSNGGYSTPNCDDKCLINKKYSCSGPGGTCVEDPNGKWDVSNCNLSCGGSGKSTSPFAGLRNFAKKLFVTPKVLAAIVPKFCFPNCKDFISCYPTEKGCDDYGKKACKSCDNPGGACANEKARSEMETCYQTHEATYSEGYKKYKIGLDQINYFETNRGNLGNVIAGLVGALSSSTLELSLAFEKLQDDWAAPLQEFSSENQESAIARAQIDKILNLRTNSEDIINHKIPDINSIISNINALQTIIDHAPNGVDVTPLTNIMTIFNNAIKILNDEVIGFVYTKIGPKGLGDNYKCGDGKCTGSNTFLCRLKCFEDKDGGIGRTFEQLITYTDILKNVENAAYGLTQAGENIKAIEPSMDMNPVTIKPNLVDEVDERAQCCTKDIDGKDCLKGDEPNICSYRVIDVDRDGKAILLEGGKAKINESKCAEWTTAKCKQKTSIFVGQRGDQGNYQFFKDNLLANPLSTLEDRFAILSASINNYLMPSIQIAFTDVPKTDKKPAIDALIKSNDISAEAEKNDKGEKYRDLAKEVEKQARYMWWDLIWGNAEVSQELLPACSVTEQILTNDPADIQRQCIERPKKQDKGVFVNTNLLPSPGGQNTQDGYNKLKTQCSTLSNIDLDVLENLQAPGGENYITDRIAELNKMRGEIGFGKVACPKWFCVNPETLTRGAGMASVDQHCIKNCGDNEKEGTWCDTIEGIIWDTAQVVGPITDANKVKPEVCELAGIGYDSIYKTYSCNRGDLNIQCGKMMQTDITAFDRFPDCKKSTEVADIEKLKQEMSHIAFENCGRYKAGIDTTTYNYKSVPYIACPANLSQSSVIASSCLMPNETSRTYPDIDANGTTNYFNAYQIANSARIKEECLKKQNAINAAQAIIDARGGAVASCPWDTWVCQTKESCTNLQKACGQLQDGSAFKGTTVSGDRVWPPEGVTNYISVENTCISTQQEIITLNAFKVMLDNIGGVSKLDTLTNNCTNLNYQKDFARDCYDFSILQKASHNNKTAISENWKEWNPDEFTTKPAIWIEGKLKDGTGIITKIGEDVEYTTNAINGFCRSKDATEGKVITETIKSGTSLKTFFDCSGDTVKVDLTDSTTEAQQAREVALKLCSQATTDMRTPLNEVMKVFSVLLGVKSGTASMNGLSALYFDAQKIRQQAESVIKLIEEAPKKFDSLWSSEDEINKIGKDNIGVKPVKCIAGPMISYASGGKPLTGANGGQVCPNVGEQFSQLDASFSDIRQNLRLINMARIQPTTAIGYGNLSVDIPDIDLVDQDLNEVVGPIYERAKEIKSKAQLLWALATAINYANENCTCGQSYCPMLGKIPLCVSGLPLTVAPLKQPFCHLIWTLRYPLGSLAQKLKQELEQP